MSELSRIDPKCWVCGCCVRPIEVTYNVLLCENCKIKKNKEL